MALQQTPSALDNCCQPGDITVTRIHTGYLIGRALPEQGPGPWWQYVAVLEHYEDAEVVARQMSARAGTKAWLHREGDIYEPLPPDDPWSE